MSLTHLARLSRRYGQDENYVLAGGGNTSFKDEQHLYIKPSGVFLKDISEKDFVKLDRSKIEGVFCIGRSEEPSVREDKVKRAMAYSVAPGTEGRPSVEAPLHHLITYKYVVHLHPAYVNGMTCGRNGRSVCESLFPEALWMDFIDPGYALSAKAGEEIAKFAKRRGRCPNVIFLKNHGVFVGADTPGEIEDIYTEIMSTLEDFYRESGVGTVLEKAPLDKEAVFELAPALRSLLGDAGSRRTVLPLDSFRVAGGPLTPDHIVYAGSFALEIDTKPEGIARKLEKFRQEKGRDPVVLSVPGKAVFVCGQNLKAARIGAELARDAALVLQLAKAFGGPVFLSERARKFIENWEVESYRKKAIGGAAGGLVSKVALVTGGAQGFGYGIAEGLVREGASVCIADLNLKGAENAAKELIGKYGPGVAVPIGVNIADENSVRGMVEQAVLAFGGLDIFVANAGVLKAGSVKSFSLRDWEFVTNVNYTGYFLCVKHVSALMARQNKYGCDWTDIVQINSKSGLVGSNRNAAYAGSKFGTIGQTQSFALELIEDKIKVNSICPGNFFDGPLWSDPVNGLFVQYLNSKKVPGAKNIGDVKKFYESKIPMSRGCVPDDVVRAIVYCVCQKYETGQAIAVTGGQVLLH